MEETNVKEELSESGEATGIERDPEEELTLEPFDPDSISIDQKLIPMDTLIRRLNQKSIHLSPSFQRNEVWDDKRRSRLIESIMLKIPLPMFYVAANELGQWEVVDGLQRLSTIRNFIVGNKGSFLRLRDLEFLGSKYNGKLFSDFNEDERDIRLVNTIMETEMRFTIINPGTPEAVKRNIFKRINTGGMPLTAHEIRHALYEGKSSALLRHLADSHEFKTAVDSNINDTRMGAQELILRFISFMVLGRRDFKSSMDSWLSNTMRVINCMPELENKLVHKIFQGTTVPTINIRIIDHIEDRFKSAMIRNGQIFGAHAFRKSLPGTKKTPINKALFETWSNVLSELTDFEFDILYKRKARLISKYEPILSEETFLNSIGRNSSQPKDVAERYDTISRIVHATIMEKQ
ncbi:DUF262 domain-containing protein [Pseudomonas kurunegalensis]|uniref:DUF262 domain-containing protein n=1 Tax=Pseudomonas kurunegalensis TaxID=485880 RepID=UPI0023644355|nr:DUF262 domain-containing protein [Pseudomonas kurunegalensis]MDD2133475.1 DUF262 domain-containing protein [Pseudomonas kurunegalensis]